MRYWFKCALCAAVTGAPPRPPGTLGPSVGKGGQSSAPSLRACIRSWRAGRPAAAYPHTRPAPALQALLGSSSSGLQEQVLEILKMLLDPETLEGAAGGCPLSSFMPAGLLPAASPVPAWPPSPGPIPFTCRGSGLQAIGNCVCPFLNV